MKTTSLTHEELREAAIRRRVHQLAEFYRHCAVFFVFMVPVWIANALLFYYWPGFAKSPWLVLGFMMTAGWAIGLVCHAVVTLPFWRILTPEWEERKVQEILDAQYPNHANSGAAK